MFSGILTPLYNLKDYSNTDEVTLVALTFSAACLML